jgi:hypothetical protein
MKKPITMMIEKISKKISKKARPLKKIILVLMKTKTTIPPFPTPKFQILPTIPTITMAIRITVI